MERSTAPISGDDPAGTRALITRMLEKMKSDFTVHMVAGIITAMLCQPGMFSPDDAMGTFREDKGANGKPFTGDDLAALHALLETYWAQLEALLESEMESDDPWPFDFCEDDFPDDQKYTLAILHWMCGFMDVVDVYDNVWVQARARPDLADHWEILDQWGNPSAPGGLFEKAAERNARVEAGGPGGAAGDEGAGGNQSNPRAAIVAIYHALREETQEAE